MPKRRSQVEMTAEEQRTFLENGTTLHVATIGPRGAPHLVAMFYALEEDGRVIFTTFRKSQKIKNIERNPKITVMLEEGKKYSELKGLVIEGEAEVLDSPEETLRVFELAGRRQARNGTGTAGAPLTREQRNATAQKRVVVRVNPVNVISWDHTKLGGTY